MGKRKSPPAAGTPAEASAPVSNGEAAAEKEKTIITDFTLKLQHHKDIPTVPTFLDSIESWAKSKGYLIQKKETSTPGYHSWALHTPATLADAEAKANNVMKEVRSLREDDTIKAEATKLGITVDELLKRALAKVRQEIKA
jgi:hypothetical protein